MSQPIGDWRGKVNEEFGPGDPIKLLQAQYTLSMKPGQGNVWPNVRRKLLARGLDDYTAVQVEQAFGGGGASAYDSAKRLGLADIYNANRPFGLRPH